MKGLSISTTIISMSTSGYWQMKRGRSWLWPKSPCSASPAFFESLSRVSTVNLAIESHMLCSQSQDCCVFTNAKYSKSNAWVLPYSQGHAFQFLLHSLMPDSCLWSPLNFLGPLGQETYSVLAKTEGKIVILAGFGGRLDIHYHPP